MVYYKKKVER